MPRDLPLPPPEPRLKLCAVRALFVLLGLAAWFWTQGLLGARPNPAGDEQVAAVAGHVLVRGDALLELSAPLNVYLNENKKVAHGLLIASSAMIDLLGIFLLGWSVLGASLRPFIGLLMLFAMRQVSQALCALPQPVGLIWDDPGFPSLLVTYHVDNDFFFSGHTAIAVLGAIELGRFAGGRLKGKAGWGAQCAIGVGAFFLVAVVLVLRAHYTMDVFTGVIAAALSAIVAGRVAPACDGAMRRLVGLRDGASCR